jgi:hypothetical protein
MAQRRLYSKAELAVELEKDRATVGNILRNIPPDGELNGHPAYYVMTAFRAVYLSQDGAALDPTQERARKDKELADKTALQNAVTRGELFSGAVVTRLVVDAFSRVRTRFLALPTYLAPVVAHTETIHEIEAVISDGVNDTLGELSEPAVLRAAGADTARSLDDASGLVQDTEASTAPDDQRVGRQRAQAKPRGERRARAVEHEPG